MKITYIATGAANMYCGSCMRDNTLAAALKQLGEDLTLLPLYTPMRLDEQNVGEEKIFFGGIEAYVLQQLPNGGPLRDALARLSGSQALLKLMPRFDFGSAVDPVKNAELTLSMLRGADGNQRRQLDELVEWLQGPQRPQLIHVTNTLISGVAPALKQRLGVPLVCGLHGEDIFLQGLPSSHQQQALDLIRANSEHIDHFIAVSQYYADFFCQWVGIPAEKVTVVRPGINLADYQQPALTPLERPLTIGYFARISPEKGLHLLAEAFIRLCQGGKFPGLQLQAGGYLSRAHAGYVEQIRRRLHQAGLAERAHILGTLERPQKLAFFRSLDVFSVPTIYRDPKGLPVLEALANGVPVVQPAHGAFPELLQATGGGRLHQPEDPADLAARLAELLRDPALRRTLGQHGRVAVHEHFSDRRMALETRAVYARLLASAQGEPI